MGTGRKLRSLTFGCSIFYSNSFGFFLILISLLSTKSISADEPDQISPMLDVGESAVEFGEEGEMVLSLKLGDKYLSSGMFAQVKNGIVFYPLGELTSLLGFPILVDAVGLEVEGWYIDPSKTLDIQKRKNSLYIESSNEFFYVSKNDFMVDEFDIYFPSSILERLFPISLSIDVRTQTVSVKSHVELPLEKYIRRRESSNALRLEKNSKIFNSELKSKIPSYKFIDLPTHTISVNTSLSGSGGFSDSYSIESYGDLLGLNGKLYLDGSIGEKPRNAFVSLGRRDPAGGLLGPLKLTELKVGDVSSSSPAVLGGSAYGLGFRVSNRPLVERFDENTVSLFGPLKPDYDVEVYVNGRLVEYFRENGSGRYEFDEIRLDYGKNEVLIKMYGINGEIETRKEHYYVDENSYKVGELLFDYEYILDGKSVFSDSLSDSIDSEETSGTVSSLNLTLGLGRNIALKSTIVEENSEDVWFHGSTDFQYKRFSFSVGTARDPNDNYSYSLGVSSYRGLLNYSAGIAFTEEEYRRRADVLEKREGGVWKVSSSLSKSHDYTSNTRSSAWRVGSSLSRNGDGSLNFGLSTSMDMRRSKYQGLVNMYYSKDISDKLESLSGDVYLRTRAESSFFMSRSLGALYDILPKSKIKEVSFASSLALGKDWSSGARVKYLFDSKELEVSAGARKKFFRHYNSVGVYHRGSDEFGVNFGFSTNIGKNVNSYTPRFESRDIASAANVGVLVFLDHNENGVRDEGERSFEGIGIEHNGLPTGVKTNRFGYALVESLSADRKHDITVEDLTITDPSLRSVDPEFAYIPRPSRLPILELALVTTGEVEGYVNYVVKDRKVAIPNVKLTLKRIDEVNEHEIEMYTEYDGLFTNVGIPVGSYLLTVDREYLRATGLKSVPESFQVDVALGDSLWTGLNFELEKTLSNE